VTVTGTLQRLDGAPVVTTPKTPSAARTIVLPAVASDALKRQKAQQDAWRETTGWQQDSGFVFTGETGQPLHHSTVQHALKRECARLGLSPITPHGLRHLHASLLLHEGVPVPAVSARLGHANPNVTMQIYAHALAGQDAQAALAIGRALAPASAPATEGTGT
jgi:integrase